MRSIFERYGVQVVAMSSDPPDKVALHVERDGLESLTLLSDERLEAIAKLGLVHPRAYPFKTVIIAGQPLFGWPTLPRKLGIPTSILVDEEGTVRWIDQAEDYRMRGDQARIEAALAEAWPQD